MKPSCLLYAIVLCLATLSCKKDNGPAVLRMSYNGLPVAGDTLQLSASVGSSFYWDFGDTTVSTETKPLHVYRYPGTFKIKLIVNGDNAHRLDTFMSIYENPVYTKQIAGTYNWHHSSTMYEEGWPPATTAYADVAFAVTYIDLLTIAINSDTLHFYGKTDSTLRFYHTYYAENIYPTGSYDVATFNYKLQSISFFKYYHISAGAYSTEYFYTY